MTDKQLDRRKLNPLIFAPLLITLALVGLFAITMLGERDPSQIKSVHLGEPAPVLDSGFLLPAKAALDPEKPTVVNFFASWCVPCRAEHESLTRLAATGDVNLIGVVFQDNPIEALLFLQELGNPYTQTLKDPDASLAFGFGVSAVPETFVIDKAGILRFRFQGPIVGDGLETLLGPEVAKWQ